jgi:drug/metabolite transporter (DMT)-like permease
MKKIKLKGPLFLLLAAFFWGTTFVAQDLASDAVGPFTFNGARMVLGALFLLPVVLVRGRGKEKEGKENPKKMLTAAILCALVLFVAANLQQFGIELGTSAGKSGFITAMYVVMVPVLGIFLGKKISPILWGCVAISAIGLYLLCLADFSAGISGIARNFAMSGGDLLTLFCAVFFTLHITLLDRLAPDLDGVKLSCLQFLFAGLLGLLFAFLFEKPTLQDLLLGSGGILYSAFFSCAVAYTFQILGQQSTPAVIASILMCLESVFAVLSDLVVLKNVPRTEEILGCILLFAALVFSSLSGRIPLKKQK